MIVHGGSIRGPSIRASKQKTKRQMEDADDPFWDPHVPGRCGRGRGRGCYSLLSSFQGLMPHLPAVSSEETAANAPPETRSKVEPAAACQAAVQFEPNDISFDVVTLRLRLLAFYRQREPAKLAQVGRVVQAYLNNQAELNRLLQQRYGADLFTGST